MQQPFSLFVGLRYTLTRKHNLLLSFVSLISMLGVSLGVLILIVALSIINGSITTLRAEALKSVPHVTVAGVAVVEDWRAQAERAMADPAVAAAAPYLEGEATLRYQGQTEFIRLRGVDPDLEAAVVSNPSRLYRELLEALASTDNGIILGTQLAGALGIYQSREVSITALGSLLSRSLSDSRGFQVVGFADFGVYGNNNIALVNLDQASAMFADDAGAELQLRLRVNDVFAAGAVAGRLFAGADYQVRPWQEVQASLFNALNMEKFLTSFMLLMIVVIGAVNIISTLVMVVADKGSDIAILRTMGASRGAIMRIFMVQGLVAGLFGTAVGALAGVLLAANITELSRWLEQGLGALLNSEVYLISHLRTQIDPTEVGLVCLAAIAVSLLATLYPAYRASKVHPAEVLRYE